MAGALFVLRALWLDLDQVLVAVRGARWEWMGAAAVLALASMVGLGLGWRKALVMFGVSAPLWAALRWFFVGQLGKYVPGGIWSVVGPAELAVGGGASRSRAYGGMLIAVGAAYLAAIATTMALLPFQPALRERVPWAAALALLIPVGILLTHPEVMARIVRIAAKVSGRPLAIDVPDWGASIGLMIRHIPVWVAIGAATWCVAQALGPSVPLANIAAAGILAWIAGFLAVPVPGGLGVREAVFTVAATSLEPGIAAATALLSRALFMCIDGCGAGLTLVLVKPVRAGSGPTPPSESGR